MISSSHFSVRSSGARVLALRGALVVRVRWGGFFSRDGVRRRYGGGCERVGRMKTL